MDQPAENTTSLWSLITSAIQHSNALENGILLLLVICSVISWALIIMKWRLIRQAKTNGKKLQDAFNEATHSGQILGKEEELGRSPQLLVFKAAIDTVSSAKQSAPVVVPDGQIALKSDKNLAERVTLAMDHASKDEFTRMQKGMDVLASIGSSTPFIGLFGTVMGIMGTFQVLGTAKSASLNVVAPGISAALIATAAGLAVAIPAVFAYNWLMARMDETQEEAGMFSEKLAHWLQASGALDDKTPGAAKAKGDAKSKTAELAEVAR